MTSPGSTIVVSISSGFTSVDLALKNTPSRRDGLDDLRKSHHASSRVILGILFTCIQVLRNLRSGREQYGDISNELFTELARLAREHDTPDCGFKIVSDHAAKLAVAVLDTPSYLKALVGVGDDDSAQNRFGTILRSTKGKVYSVRLSERCPPLEIRCSDKLISSPIELTKLATDMASIAGMQATSIEPGKFVRARRVSGSSKPGTPNTFPSAPLTGVHHTTRVVTLASMYKTISAALDTVRPGDTIYLTSFQLHYPPYKEPLDEWQKRLVKWLKTNGQKVRVKRLITVQSLDKLLWMDELSKQLGGSATKFDVRLYPAWFEWESPAPLPMPIQIVGSAMFIGGIGSKQDGSQEDRWALEVLGDHEVRSFLIQEHKELWSFAGTSHLREIDKGDLMRDGHMLGEAMRHLRCSAYSRFVAQGTDLVRDTASFDGFVQRVPERLIALNEDAPGWHDAFFSATTSAKQTSIHSCLIASWRAGQLSSHPYVGRSDREGHHVTVSVCKWRKGSSESVCFGEALEHVFVLKGTAMVTKQRKPSRQGSSSGVPRRSRRFAAGGQVAALAGTSIVIEPADGEALVLLRVRFAHSAE